MSIELAINDLEGKNYKFSIEKLMGEIEPEKSTFL